MPKTQPAHSARRSGIELLKILAIFMIVISHVIQTMHSPNPFVPYRDYLIDLDLASCSLSNFILVLMRHFGVLGNTVFFICSAWFWLESDKFSKKKWFFMFSEIWFISVLFLLGFEIYMHGDLPLSLAVKSLFPTLFKNNWYLTCYLLFYPIHPMLNYVIKKMSQKVLFRTAFVSFMLYGIVNFIKWGFFFTSSLILWVSIYFVTAYVKQYAKLNGNKKKNVVLLISGIAGFVLTSAVLNILGLKIPAFDGKMLHTASNSNPFLIIITFALLNLCEMLKFKSAPVNYISSLSLLIYIIHDNLIVRTYLRPFLINLIYEKSGYGNKVLFVLLFAGATFLFSLAVAFLYDKTLRRPFKTVSGKVYELIKNVYLRAEAAIL